MVIFTLVVLLFAWIDGYPLDPALAMIALSCAGIAHEMRRKRNA